SKFWIEPTRDAQGVGYVLADDAVLRVTVGRVTNHSGMAHDLIADLGRSEDPKILRVYQRVLMARNNNDFVDRKDWDHTPRDERPGLADQPLKQITEQRLESKWNCGGALDHFGQNFVLNHGGYTADNVLYYKPLKPQQISPTGEALVSDLVFDAD